MARRAATYPGPRAQVSVALAMIDALEAQIAPLDKELRAYARSQAGSKPLMTHYGIGPLVAVTILAELRDRTRFCSSRRAVRHAGMPARTRRGGTDPRMTFPVRALLYPTGPARLGRFTSGPEGGRRENHSNSHCSNDGGSRESKDT